MIERTLFSQEHTQFRDAVRRFMEHDVVPHHEAWEDQGYPGYDGYGWYRKHFKTTHSIDGKFLLLKMGTIDDADEVYVNGRFIGFCGSFPPAWVWP